MTAIIVFIVLRVLALLLGVGLFGFEVTHPKSSLGISPEIAKDIGYLSLGVGVFIVALLVAGGQYLIGAGLVVAWIVLPLLAAGGVRLGPRIGTRSPSPVRRSLAESAVAREVSTLYASVRLDPGDLGRQTYVRRRADFCLEGLTLEARHQLEQAFPGPREGSLRTCALALGAAARAHAFGPPPSSYRGTVSRTTFAPQIKAAHFDAENGIRLDLVQTAGKYGQTWRIERFEGARFSG